MNRLLAVAAAGGLLLLGCEDKPAPPVDPNWAAIVGAKIEHDEFKNATSIEFANFATLAGTTDAGSPQTITIDLVVVYEGKVSDPPLRGTAVLRFLAEHPELRGPRWLEEDKLYLLLDPRISFPDGPRRATTGYYPEDDDTATHTWGATGTIEVVRSIGAAQAPIRAKLGDTAFTLDAGVIALCEAVARRFPVPPPPKPKP